MADENQNKHEHSATSFKEQILQSLRGDAPENDQPVSSGDTNTLPDTSDREETSEAKVVEEAHAQPDSNDGQTDEVVQETPEPAVVGSRSEKNHSIFNQKEPKNFLSTEEKTEPNPNEEKRNTRRKEDRMVNRIVLIVVSVLIFVIIVFGFTFYKYVNDGLQPLDKNDKDLVQVNIPQGSTNKQIAAILEEDKIIKSSMVFNYYMKFKNMADFQAGYYQMSPNMTLDEIGGLLRQGGSAEPTQIADGKVTIPEGYDIEKIGDAIEKNTDFKKSDFLDLMKDEAYFQTLLQEYPELLQSASEATGVRYRLEGYLFPATYDYYKDMELTDFVRQMVTKTNSVIHQFIPTIQAKGLTVHEVLTLASLVEKEGVTESDRRNIAQVFWNRLEIEMPLQSDIAILYALGEHKELVTNADLEVDSPYNLYVHPGYGPGPYDSPSEQAIGAVLNPEPNDYLYFVADISTGKVYFSKTYEEHQKLVDKYVNNSSE